MKSGLKKEVIEKIHGVFRKYPEIEEAIIYGSRALGTYREGSDIDLALRGKNLSYDLLLKLNAEIDELNTPYLFDLSALDLITNPELIEHIKRTGQIFYRR